MHAYVEDDLPLARLYRWERERAQSIYLTQPYDHGKIREWTWAQAADEARRIAAYLKAQNWEPGSRVAILSRNCAWWLMADLAIWMAGHVSVPIYPSLNARTIRQILEHSEAKACFIGATDEKISAGTGIPEGVACVRFPTAPFSSCASWDDVVAANAPLAGNPMRAAEELATIIYTSGTTGTPKGVMHRFGSFGFFGGKASKLLGLTPDDRILSYLPLAHIIERCACECLSMFVGFHVFFTEGLETFITDLKRARPTMFPSVPRLLLKFQQGVFQKLPRERLEKMLRIPILKGIVKKRIINQLGLGDARYAASGGAPLPLEILMWYRGLGLELFEGFGLTETFVTHIPAPGHVRPGFVGAALEGVEVKTSPEGELLMRSPMNMMGYFKNPEMTQDSFTEDGFFRTGDLVHLDADGQVKIIGRVKEQFKTSKGKYVAPAPIESRMMAHPSVEACCVMGASLPNPFAIVVLSAESRQRCDSQDSQRQLEDSLVLQMREVNEQLDPHERLNFIAIADGPWTINNELLTPTLKVKRAALERRYLPLVQNWDKRENPVVWESPPFLRPPKQVN